MRVGFCRKCGSAVKLPVETGTQAEWDEMATEACRSCRGKPKKERRKMHKDRLTLATMCGGAIQEKFNRSLKKVMDNILDPNMDPEKKRIITIKLTFQPNEKDPEQVGVDVKVQEQLPAENGVGTMMFMSKDLETGKGTVVESRRGEIKGQLDFSDVWNEAFDPETGEVLAEEQGTVIDMRRKA